MLEVRNRTPYRVRLFHALDRDGRDTAVVAIKSTHTIGTTGLSLAAEQVDITFADEHHGEPESSSVRYESDLAPAKLGTDVVLNGTAYAARGAVTSLGVELRAGALARTVLVHGDRSWLRGGSLSSPRSFTEMPLVYERAFGGADKSHSDPAQHLTDRRNPAGVGFCTRPAERDIADVGVPNLEDPSEPLRALGDKPAPAGFGFIHRSWEPRAGFGGTYDPRWKRERAPLPPTDYQLEHHQSASRGLWSKEPFRGDETISATNVRPAAMPLSFRLPGLAMEVSFRLRGGDQVAPAVLDTVLIEPDLDRVVLTHRAAISCPRLFLTIERVVARDREGG